LHNRDASVATLRWCSGSSRNAVRNHLGFSVRLRRSPQTRWINLSSGKRQELNSLFALNRKLFKAYMLKEKVDRLWNHRYEGAMLNYLQRWMDQLRWQRLRLFEKLAGMLLNHLEGILNYCRTKVPLGMVEAINGTSSACYAAAVGIKTSATYCSKPNAWPPPEPTLWFSGKQPKMRVEALAEPASAADNKR
jgi:hypothetical protein